MLKKVILLFIYKLDFLSKEDEHSPFRRSKNKFKTLKELLRAPVVLMPNGNAVKTRSSLNIPLIKEAAHSSLNLSK
jgi:hypothetical protein